MEKNNLSFRNFEIKAVDESDGMVISGYAAVFNIPDDPDYWRCADVIKPGAFTKTLQENKDRIAFCYQHDIYTPIGKIIELTEDARGLYIKARISDAEDDIKTKIREKILREMSIGYQTIKYEMYTPDDGEDIRYLTEVKLWEVSLVTLAKNKFALLDEVKGINRMDVLSDEFDKVIAIERNEQKKYSLLMLKSLALEPQEALKPPKESIFSKLSFTNKN
jgi:HK97 family phage prohead protease